MDKPRLLKLYSWIFGLVNVFIISFTVPLDLGDLFLWHPRNVPDEMMISAIDLAMGILMICSTNHPLVHKSFLDFVIIANIFHAFVMLIYAKNLHHVLFDVVTVGTMGALPLFFYPRGPKSFLGYPNADA